MFLCFSGEGVVFLFLLLFSVFLFFIFYFLFFLRFRFKGNREKRSDDGSQNRAVEP